MNRLGSNERFELGLRTVANVQVFGRRHHERRRVLRRPASKKRQGTKSRGVWPPLRAAGVMGI